MRWTLTFLTCCITSFLPAQTASFTPSPVNGCSPLVVTFDGGASGGTAPLHFDWDFGNGNTSAGVGQSNPGALYLQPGIYTVTLVVTDANGNSSAPATQTVIAFGAPQAAFSLSQTTGCPPFQVEFTDLSQPASAPIVSWIWDFGDGNSSQVAAPTHSYGTGNFPVSLIVTDANGCQGVTVMDPAVAVYPSVGPSVQFNGPRRACAPSLSVPMQATASSAGPHQYLWDFGDGNQATGASVTHTWLGYGLYDLRLVVIDLTSGCSDTLFFPDHIQLLDNQVDFSFTPATGCAPLSVGFTDQSSLLLNDFIATWDFGDGNVLTGIVSAPTMQQPTHVYATPGTYYPSLSIDMGNGCIESFQSLVAIEVGGPQNITFTVDTAAACQGPLSVTFTPQTPGAVSWWWDFGDGDTSSLASPTHVYVGDGLYDVSLQVEDANGCIQVVTIPDLVRIEAPQAAFIDNLAGLTVYPQLWDGRDPVVIRGGCLPLDVAFTDQSTSPTPIVSWQWDFGDGNTSNGPQNPSHTYLNEGEFSVSLTITTIDGCVSTVQCDSCIRAGNQPTALLDTSAYPLLQCCSPNTDFINVTDSGTHDYVWYAVTTGDWDGFEVNDTSNGDWAFGTTVPVFMDSGQYVSTMFYAYNYGCVDSFHLKNWSMLRPPYASAGIDQFVCASNWPPGGTVVFDTSMVLYLLDTASIDSVLWQFGDPANTTSNEFFPTFTYPDTGAYWLTITVWDFDNGCSCTTSGEQFLEIKVLPDTTFLVNPTQGCAPLLTQFNGPSTGVTTWDWQLSGGIVLSSEDPNPAFLLEDPGWYDLSLIVANADGCADTVIRPELIRVDGLRARVATSDSVGCLPFSLTLTDQSYSTAPVISRSWDLGDGRILTGNDPSVNVTYDSIPLLPLEQGQGLPVVLTVTDSAGCVDSDTLWLLIGNPTPAYLLDRSPSCAGDTLRFIAIREDSLGLMPLRYAWAGLGQSDSSATWEIFAPTGGPYPIAVTAIDSLGCATTRIDSLWLPSIAPTAALGADPILATCPPLVVQFSDSSQPGFAPIAAWRWDFGDGSSSQLADPLKIYSQIGSYGVSLIVTDSLGCRDTLVIPDLIRLTGVQGTFQISDDDICDDETLTFVANSPNATNFTWDFGDGNLATGQTVTHTYTQLGVQYPSLILQDPAGLCSNTVRDTIVIHPRPQAPDLEDDEMCTGDSLLLLTNEFGAQVLWSTGDTTASIWVRAGGTYEVTLTFPETGCARSKEVAILEHPLPAFSVEAPERLCLGDTLLALASSPEPVTYRWFQLSAFTRPSDPELMLIPPRDQGLRLQVRSEEGCVDEWDRVVRVFPEPILSLDHEPVCEGDTLWLDATPVNVSDSGGWYVWFVNDLPLLSQEARVPVIEPGLVEVSLSLGGCEGGANTSVAFYPLPPGDRFSEQMNCVYMGEPVTLDAGPGQDWLWDHSFETTRLVEVVKEGWYPFSVFNEFGCEHRDSAWVYDACPPLLYVPSAFSPNGDSQNEFFTWGWDYVDEFEMSIYSRWGMKLYSTEDKNGRWDGGFGGKISPEGVYVWVVQYNGTHPAYRAMMSRSGTVTLFR